VLEGLMQESYSMKYYKLFPLRLTIVTLVIFVFFVIKLSLFNSMPAPYVIFYQAGLLFETIASSIIASYFFYIIVVFIKDLSDSKHIYPHIHGWANRIVQDCEDQLQGISYKTDSHLLLNNITEESIVDIFKKISPKKDAPGIMASGKAPDWLQYFNFHKIKTHDRVVKILAQIIYIDAELVKLITDIDECDHFMTLNAFPNTDLIANETLEHFATHFYAYCAYCRKLEKYLQK
jgi:hypothetical protein